MFHQVPLLPVVHRGQEPPLTPTSWCLLVPHLLEASRDNSRAPKVCHRRVVLSEVVASFLSAHLRDPEAQEAPLEVELPLDPLRIKEDHLRFEMHVLI